MEEPSRPTTRKLNQQYVEDYLRWQGCELLGEYQGVISKIKYKCSCGNEGCVDFRKFKAGQRCKKCGQTNRINKGKKLSLEYVLGFFQDRGCKLLEAEYKNVKTKMRYMCSCGNEAMVCFDKFRAGYRCKKCVPKKPANKQRNKLGFPRTDQVKVLNLATAFLTDRGYEYISTQYENENYAITYRCKCNKVIKKSCYNIITSRTLYCRHVSVNDKPELKLAKAFRQKCNKMLKYILKQIGKIKKDKTHVLLGYSYKDLINRIVIHPNWNNVKDGKWHLDHIFPIKAFIKNNIHDLTVINALDNLQPLSVHENTSKSDKYNPVEFQEWLVAKGICIDNII